MTTGPPGGEGIAEPGEWLDCECPECGAWFTVGERMCPSCGTGSRWADEEPVDRMLDELLDELEAAQVETEWEEIEAPVVPRRKVRVVVSEEPPVRKRSLGSRLRSLFS